MTFAQAVRLVNKQHSVASSATCVAHLRCSLSNITSDKVGAKIRNARMERVPNMAILGQQEIEQGTVSVRIRGEEQPITKTVQQFIDDLLTEIANRSL